MDGVYVSSSKTHIFCSGVILMLILILILILIPIPIPIPIPILIPIPIPIPILILFLILGREWMTYTFPQVKRTFSTHA